MATTYGDTVNAFYLAYYGRPADPAGLAFWTAALQKNNGDFSTIVNAFSTSPEATSRFAGESVSDRITDIYQQLFGRAPDKTGLDFWVQAIGSGRLTMANAAIEIMHGAQNTDVTVSTARQQVAAQFTAEVEKSGIAYNGDAAVQAARVLISAVNANSTPADIDNLVKAGASLVQTAHDNPAVIKALANGGDLSAVLNTSSGKADPVSVVQALASIGKAALTDSAGLSVLLQGGGMAGLLDSLPIGTSVKDVATAVSNGGLSAGSQVVNPPAPDPLPPAVEIKPTIAFVGADGKDLPADTTLVANSFWYFVAVHGRPANSTTTFQISSTGNANDWQTVSEDVDQPDGAYFIRYVVKDAAGNSGASNALKLVMDHSVPSPNVALAQDTGITPLDRITSNGAVKISGLNANETWYYSFDNKNWTKGTTDANGQATIADSGATGKQALVVRTLETVNGKSQFTYNTLNYTVDKAAPAAPAVALVADSGPSNTDHITNNAAVKLSGLETGTTWQFSTDKGVTWKPGAPVQTDGTSTMITATGTGVQSLLVHATDAAGNVSPNTSFDYTVYTYLNGLLSVIGKSGPEINSNTKGLAFSVMMAGHSDGVSTVYQVSTTGKADDFKAWDAAQNLADGTYYFRATGSDLAGNAYISNTLTVHLDNTAPAAPAGVKLQSDTGVAGDGITQNGSFVVSGLEKGALWQYSLDGKTWNPGTPVAADGTASGYIPLSGEHNLQVRTYDLAGNTSEALSLHFTLDNNLPALGLTLNGADPASHALHTTQAKVDLVFSYKGTVDAGDSFDYTREYTGDDATTTWIKIDSVQIDTVNKTITIPGFDLSSKDVFLTLRGSDVAGKTTYQAAIDGPFTDYFSLTSAVGPKVYLNGQQTAHLYLTDGSNAPAQVKTLDASGDLVSSQNGTLIGVQSVAIKGVLGAGSDAALQTVNDKAVIYAFGTAGDDTLSGNDVWSFGGNDTITATGSATYNSAYIVGGAGADVIHTETSSSQLVYTSSTESSLVADDAVAHGFDTVYISNGGPTRFTDVLNMEDIKLGDLYKQAGAANFSGNETGNALLALLDTAVGTSFKTGLALSQAALVSFGSDGGGHNVNFLVVDADKDGHITSADYVVKIVGSIGSISASHQAGMVFLDTLVTPL
jgi:phosphoribosyl-AMP cyclohydrolase